MGYSNGAPTIPVNTDDLISATGTSSHDVATLCESNNINKWAKYKPQQGGGPGILSDNDRRANRYGIGKVPLFTSALSMCQWMAGITTVRPSNFNALRGQTYTYLKPDIANSDWHRMTDFFSEDGTKAYNSKAVAPLQRYGQSEVKVYSSGTGGQFFLFAMNQNELDIRMSDIMNIVAEAVGTTEDFSSQWYLGVGIYLNGNWGIATQGTPLSQILLRGASVEVDIATMKTLIGTGTGATVFPFICDIPPSQGTTTFQRFTKTTFQMVPLVFAYRGDVNFVAYNNTTSLGYLTVSFNVSGSTNIGYRAHYGIVLKSTGGTSIVKAIKVEFYNREGLSTATANNFTPVLTANPLKTTDTPLTLASGQSKVYNSNINTTSDILYSIKCARLTITMNSGNIHQEMAEMGAIMEITPGLNPPLT